MVYKGVEKPNYYVITKAKIRGKHIVTPYASKPTDHKGYVVVSAKKYHYKLNENGYAHTSKLPENTLKKKVVKRKQFNNPFGFVRGFNGFGRF